MTTSLAAGSSAPIGWSADFPGTPVSAGRAASPSCLTVVLSRNLAGSELLGASVTTVAIKGAPIAVALTDIDDERMSTASATLAYVATPDLTTNTATSAIAAMNLVSLTPMTGGPFRMIQS